MAGNRAEKQLKNLNLSSWEVFLSNTDEETQDVYSRSLTFFCKANGFSSLEDAAVRGDEQALFSFVRFLRDRGVTPNTIRLYVTAVKRFFEAVKKPLNPFDLRLSIPKRKLTRETRAIPADLVQDIILAAPPRKKLLFHLLWATGLRIGEALSLRRKDFEMEKEPARFTVKTEKTDRPRIVFLPSDLAKKLREHLAKLGEDDFVFHVEGDQKRPLNADKVGETFRRILFRIEALKRDSSGRGYVYTLHSFRRSYETTLATCGVFPTIMKFFVGHSQGVEDSYLRFSEDDLVREWKKAEDALRLDLKKPTFPENLVRMLAASQLTALKFIENQLIHLKLLNKDSVDLADLNRRLEEVKRRISELSKLVPAEEVERIDRLADNLS